MASYMPTEVANGSKKRDWRMAKPIIINIVLRVEIPSLKTRKNKITQWKNPLECTSEGGCLPRAELPRPVNLIYELF